MVRLLFNYVLIDCKCKYWKVMMNAVLEKNAEMEKK